MKLFDFTNMTLEIQGYGYEYSIKKFIMQLLLTYILLIVAGVLFQLHPVCIVILCVWAFFCLPIIILAQFRYLANNKKFETLVGYLEQMIFAFKKSPKILESFKTVYQVVDKGLHDDIAKAILKIENDSTGSGYKEAFAIMEKAYPCSRMQALHKFMINVETNGGDYQRSIDILLDDIRSWVSRTYAYQKELKNIKGKIMLSIILSIMIAGTMMAIIPKELIVFKDSIVYLVSTTILFIALIALIAFVQSKLNGKWFINDVTSEKLTKLQKAAIKASTYDKQKSNKQAKISCLITLPIMLMGILIKSPIVIMMGGVISFSMLMKNKWQYKMAKKSVQRALEKEFPLWLRDISLQLQTLVVPLAIQNSIQEAAPVLQPHLQLLCERITNDPTSIRPYLQFLEKYHLADVSNAMKILYTIQSLNVKDAKEQIDDLVKRNQKMLAKSEKIRNEDVLTGIGFIVALPMVMATLKLIVDLMLVLAQFMNMSMGML